MDRADGIELTSPPWNDLTLDLVLKYYDGPRLLLQRSKSEQLYLAWWSDSEESIERWIYLAVSRSRLGEILSGEIPSLDALDNPENGHIYIIDVNAESDSIIRTVLTEASAIPDNSKPQPKARLRLPMPAEIEGAPAEEPDNCTASCKIRSRQTDRRHPQLEGTDETPDERDLALIALYSAYCQDSHAASWLANPEDHADGFTKYLTALLHGESPPPERRETEDLPALRHAADRAGLSHALASGENTAGLLYRKYRTDCPSLAGPR